MGIELSAKDVFELAHQIEKRAEEFYLMAADAARDAITRDLFANLAIMERDHAQVLDGMGSVLTPAPLKLPLSSEENSKVWPVLAGGMVQNLQSELPKFFGKCSSSQDILKGAMDFERDTIVFFLGVRDMMSSPADRKRLDAIVKEEMGHLISLGSHLARLGSI